MLLPGSQWLLSVCLLSWCCDAGVLSSVDPESEPSPTPLVIWSEEGDRINMDTLIKVVEKSIPGMYIVPLEIGKDLMKDVDNNVLNASSEVCEILAKNPKLQQGYIAIIFSKRLQMLKELTERCTIPPVKDMVLVSGRKLKRIPRAQPERWLVVCICSPTLRNVKSLKRFLLEQERNIMALLNSSA